MDTLSYKTVSANKATVKKEWIVVDAQDMIVGRMASKVAKLLRGKYKPDFTPHVDCGDNVIIINAEKVRMTGNKWDERIYMRHSGYPGGQTGTSPRTLMDKSPEKFMLKVLKGMLPKNILGAQILKNLHICVGPEHPYAAQQPRMIDLDKIK